MLNHPSDTTSGNLSKQKLSQKSGRIQQDTISSISWSSFQANVSAVQPTKPPILKSHWIMRYALKSKTSNLDLNLSSSTKSLICNSCRGKGNWQSLGTGDHQKSGCRRTKVLPGIQSRCTQHEDLRELWLPLREADEL